MAATLYTDTSLSKTVYANPNVGTSTGVDGTPVGLLLILTTGGNTNTPYAAALYSTPAVGSTIYQNPTKDTGYILLDDTYYLLIDATSYFIISADAT